MPLDETYFVWLYSQVGSTTIRNKAKTYWKLLRALYTKRFTWIHEMDENRAHDGMDLRAEFGRQTGEVLPDHWLNEECSVLELLIALAWKLEWESDAKDQAGWFWDLIANLGLIDCTDANPADEEILNVVLDKFINRRYGKTGAGGLFPLRHTTIDQREVELWDQLQAYLLEHEPS